MHPSLSQHFPSHFLAAELQFSHLHSFSQTFVLQTHPAEPTLDLYFSVCVWTPSPCRWKLMSSPSPGIQSEWRNCRAIWSSSAQPQQSVPAAEDKAVNGKLCPILPQRGVCGSWEVAPGTCGQAHHPTSHCQSLWEHPLSEHWEGGSCPALLAPTVTEGRR